MVNNIYNYKTPVVYKLSSNLTLSELDAWKNEAIAELQKIVEDNYGKPIEKLIKHLQPLVQ